MSPKKRAKKLRKQLNYHPSESRKYLVVKNKYKVKGQIIEKHGMIVLDPKCTRARYQRTKRLKREVAA